MFNTKDEFAHERYLVWSEDSEKISWMDWYGYKKITEETQGE